MQHYGKKLCAILLALCMIVGFVPLTAQAALLDAEDYITQQLYLGEDLVLHLRGNVPEEYTSNATAEVTYLDETHSYSYDELTKDEDGNIDLAIEMAVAEMTENINLVLKMGIIEGINEDYSIRNYLVTLIEGNYTRETKALAQELLNYGGWAQQYFGYNTDSLANKSYDITPAYEVPSDAPAAVQTGKVSGIQFYGTSVRFLSKTAVRFYFQADSVDGYTFTVDGEAYEPVYSESNAKYYIEVSGINPQDMDNELTVAVTDGSKTLNVAYAPISYFIRSYNNTDNETFQSLMEAAYSYFMSCQDFEGVTDTGKLTFSYKEGDATSISVNTNLPADITLADFALTDNSCSVNEDACDLKASSVSMENVDGTIVLTFHFDESFAAGQVYSLPVNAFFTFADNSQYALADNYLFQFNGTDWTQIAVEGDFTAGVDFEVIGNTLLFSGEGPSTKAATVQRVAHDTEIPALTNGGDYALKLSHASSYYPTFRINFGKELAAGTTINFMAFGVIYGDSTYDYSVFEFCDGGDATVQFTSGNWTQLTMTLSEAAEYIDLFWNFDRAQLTDESTTGAVYLDNFIAVEPVEAEGDFLKGINFETAGHAAWFVGQGITERDAVIVRTAYANTDIEAPTNGGDYALKLSHPSNYWPTFRINFGKELAAGTEITFGAYGKISGESNYNKSIFEFTSGGEATVEFACDAWTELSFTLAEAAEYVDLFWNIDRAGITSTTASGEVYIDNVLAVEPVETTGDFLEGVGFEVAGNEGLFTGIGASQDATIQRIPYDFAGISAPNDNSGSYVLKVSHLSHYYPTFEMNFGKTLTAGTTITFNVMGNFDGWVSGNDMNIEYTGDSGSGQVVYMVPDVWFTATITLASDCDHLQFFYNIERGNGISGDVASRIYIDNVLAVEPALEDADFLAGVTFENAGHVSSFTATGKDSDAAIERVSYADLGIEAPSDGGSYALKVSHDSYAYPTFRINFGKTLAAGTTITFDAYAYTDGSAVVLMDSTWTQVAYLPANAWRTDLTWEITLSSDCDYIDMLWESRDYTNVASYIVMDNIVAVEPDMTLKAGLTFEEEGHTAYVSGQSVWNDATIERVTFDGDYALKLTHASSQWPAFRLNLGRTMAAGTVITFEAYSYCSSMTDVNSAKSLVVWKNSAGTEVEMHSIYGQWTTVSMTMDTDASVINLYWNMDQWHELTDTHGDYVLYLDNITAAEPISETLTFEYAADTAYFTDMGRDWSAVTVERVTYADLGIDAPSDGGEYAMKLSHGNDQYPSFRINFGKTLAAGTQIKLDILGSYDYDGENQTNCLVLYFNDPWTQVVYMGKDAWREDFTLEATLSADCSYVDLVWETRLGVDCPSYIIMDNIEFIAP